MAEEKPEKVFSLERFNQLVSHESHQNTLLQPNIIDSMQKLFKIVCLGEIEDLPEDYCVYENFTRDEIEWFADAIMNWPYDDGGGEGYGLNHGIVQFYMIRDIMRSLSHAKKEKEKGFVFI